MKMFEKALLEQKIREEINKTYKLGEHAGGSGHLSYRSISDLSIGEPKEFSFQGKKVFGIICEYKIYTETEFMHPPEMEDLFTEKHKDKIIVDEELNVLDFIDLR
jgi:hypothetical protein